MHCPCRAALVCVVLLAGVVSQRFKEGARQIATDRRRLDSSVGDDELCSLGHSFAISSIIEQCTQGDSPVVDGITALDRWNGGYRGTIPLSIGQLTALQSITLSKNSFTGTIPEVLSNLRALTYLDLGSNALSGTISEDLGGLTNLLFLQLAHNSLTGTIPGAIRQLTELTYLGFDNNQLRGTIPTSFGLLSRLRKLNLYNNALTSTIPESLSNLQSLAILSLDGNKLRGTIPDLGQYTGLSLLTLHDNGLSGTVPSSLGLVTSLARLNLAVNQLSGTFPALKHLVALSNLKVYGNELEITADSEWLPRNAELIALEYFNALSSTRNFIANRLFPGDITTLPLQVITLDYSLVLGFPFLEPLKILSLYGTPYASRFPCLLSHFTYARIGEFSSWACMYNASAPPLPTLQAVASILCSVVVSSDSVLNVNWDVHCQGDYNRSGANESWHGVFFVEGFIALDLHGIGLSGLFPPALCMIPSLIHLDVAGNRLTGNLPYTCSRLTALESLNLSGNALQGSQWRIPTNIRYLEARGNPGAVDGDGLECPEEVQSAAAFEPVFPTGTRRFCVLKPGYPASENSLGQSLVTVQGLCALWREVQRTAAVKLAWVGLCAAATTEYGKNPLTHGWPHMYVYLGHLVGLRLHEIGYAGPLPSSLFHLEELIELDMSRNHLTGPIPEGLCSMTQLRRLVLKFTHVRGSLPSCIATMRKLSHLDLSRNGYGRSGGLTGPLPPSITQLTQLKFIDLSYNDLLIPPKESKDFENWLDRIPMHILSPNKNRKYKAM